MTDQIEELANDGIVAIDNDEHYEAREIFNHIIAEVQDE